MKLSVREVNAETVTIELEMVFDGRPLLLPATRVVPRDRNRPRRHARRTGAKLTISNEDVTLAGKHWSARRLEARWIDEDIQYARTTWLAKNAPVYGILKMTKTADGEEVARMELKGYGS